MKTIKRFAVSSVVVVMAPSAAALAASVIFSRDTRRARLDSIAPTPRFRAASSMSRTITLRPAAALTSIAGLRATGSSIPYAVSKAALNHLTALLANVVGPEVRMNAVAPGLVRTPWTESWGPVHDLFAERAPLGRSGEPADVAEVIVDVAAARYVTGQVIVVDGGVTLA